MSASIEQQRPRLRVLPSGGHARPARARVDDECARFLHGLRLALAMVLPVWALAAAALVSVLR